MFENRSSKNAGGVYAVLSLFMQHGYVYIHSASSLVMEVTANIGFSNFDMARLCLALSTTITLWSIAGLISQFGPVWIYFLMIIGHLIVSAYFWKKCTDVERKCEADQLAMPNILLISFVPIRILAVLLFGTLCVVMISAVLLTQIISYAIIAFGFIAFIAYLYFLSCTPLPSAPSALRRWLQKFADKRCAMPVSDV